MNKLEYQKQEKEIKRKYKSGEINKIEYNSQLMELIDLRSTFAAKEIINNPVVSFFVKIIMKLSVNKRISNWLHKFVAKLRVLEHNMIDTNKHDAILHDAKKINKLPVEQRVYAVLENPDLAPHVKKD